MAFLLFPSSSSQGESIMAKGQRTPERQAFDNALKALLNSVRGSAKGGNGKKGKGKLPVNQIIELVNKLETIEEISKVSSVVFKRQSSFFKSANEGKVEKAESVDKVDKVEKSAPKKKGKK